jgi:hypothetical protein
MIIKPLGASQVANNSIAANTFANSTLIRVSHFDNVNTASYIYCYYANNTLRYSTLVVGGESIILEKGASDKVNCSSTDVSVQIVPVSYKS